MPNIIHQSHCHRRYHRPDGVALVVTLSMLAIVALLAIAFVLTARTEVKSGNAYNDQAFAKALAKMAVDRAAMEIYRQNKGFVVSGGEVATAVTNGASQSIILIYSTNDFTKLDNYTTDTSLLTFGNDLNGVPMPYRWPNSITHPFDGYDYVDRDGQPGRSSVEPYWIGVRDNNGVLRGRFAYVALGNLVDINAIGNINIWDSHANAYGGVNAFYMRPADTNFGYGYIGTTNAANNYTRGICPDISLPKFLLKLGYNLATVTNSAYCIIAYKYGWNLSYNAPWIGGILNAVFPGGNTGSNDKNGDGINHNPTDYKVYPSLNTGNQKINSLAQIYTNYPPIDSALTPGWEPVYGGNGSPFAADPAGSNLSSYASVGLSSDPNLYGTYVGSRVNLNLMTNGAALNNAILSNSITQLTNVLRKFPQFTNNYNNNLAQVTNKIIQIALNLIDFHTTNRYPSVFTNGVGANATVLTGIKPTPYINQIYIRYDTTFYRCTNVSVGNPKKTNYWFSTSVSVTNELWNPYPSRFPDTNNLVVTNVSAVFTNSTSPIAVNVGWSVSCLFSSPAPGFITNGIPPSINTNVYRSTGPGFTNLLAVGYYSNWVGGVNQGLTVPPNPIIITNIFLQAKLWGTNSVAPTNLIQIISQPVTNVVAISWQAGNNIAWGNNAPWSTAGVAPGTNWMAGPSVILNLEADDPRMNILYTQTNNTANNYNLGAMNATCFPTTVNIYAQNNPNYYLDTGPREGTNSFFIKTNVFPKVGSAVVTNNFYVSVGEIGYVHRGEPWATIRLQPATNYATPFVPATNYPYGEGKLLDYFRVNDLVDVAGRINLNSDTNGPAWIYAPGANANQSPALFALFSGIINSWYTNSAYANSGALPGSGNTIDGVTDDKITAIIKEIGDYRANMTNGAANFTGQNNLMTYVGELCAISNLTTYTDKFGNTQPISYTDDANREALIRAVANLVTTFEGGGTTTILAWGQAIKGGSSGSGAGYNPWGDNTNGVPGQMVKIQATFQFINGKIQMTSYQYIP